MKTDNKLTLIQLLMDNVYWMEDMQYTIHLLKDKRRNDQLVSNYDNNWALHYLANGYYNYDLPHDNIIMNMSSPRF